MIDALNIKGTIYIDKKINGEISESYEFDNILTNSGISFLSRLISGESQNTINNIALGDGTRPPLNDDRRLVNKLVLIPVTSDSEEFRQVRFFGSVPENTTDEIIAYREAGLVFKSVLEEILITRMVFSKPLYQEPGSELSILYILRFV